MTDVRFDPKGRWVYACGSGIRSYRVPARRVDDGRWEFDLPVLWPLTASQPFQLGTDRSGDVVAVVERFRDVLVTRAGRPPVRVGASHQVSYTAVSPDGELVATGPWRGSSGVQVWRANDGTKVADLPAPDTAGAAFTPDGRRVLVLGSDGVYRVHAVGTWEKLFERGDPAAGFTRGHRMAFHPDGRTVAFAHDRAAVRLTDLDAGTESVTLPYPDSHNLAAYEFSPDGRYVAAVTVRGAVQVWDLAELSARLRALGLDWRDER
jgi:WD40 repeat protein